MVAHFVVEYRLQHEIEAPVPLGDAPAPLMVCRAGKAARGYFATVI